MNEEYLKSAFGLAGRRILVVGGRGTIGAGIVKALGAAGAKVYISSRSAKSVEEAAAEYRSFRIDCPGGVAVDITERSSIDAAATAFTELCPDKRLDGIVVNSGGNVPEAVIPADGDFFTSDSDAGDRALQLNYSGARDIVKAFGPFLTKGTRPVVSFTGSVAHLGLSRVLDYGAGKAALDRLVQFLSLHLMIDQETPIRVNGVRVGFIFSEDPDSQNSFARKDPNRYDSILKHIPMRRDATPEEIGNAFVFLQSQAASYIHGTMISVDGGWESNRLGDL